MTQRIGMDDSPVVDETAEQPRTKVIHARRFGAVAIAALTGLLLVLGMTPSANADPMDPTPVSTDPAPDPDPGPTPPPAPVDLTKATLLFDARGGQVAITQKIVKIGAKVGKLPVATRTGYTFKGWFTAKSGGTKITASTKVPKWTEKTLYAHWSGKKYTVKFSPQGGKVATKSKLVKFGSSYGKLPKPTRIGYKFTGWYASDGTKVTSATKVSTTGTRTLRAQWKKLPNHWVDVNLTTHMLKMMSGNTVVATFPISGGKPSTPSPRGTFHVYAKTADQSMGGYAHVKWCTWFYPNVAIHTAYWHNEFGKKNVSHGCINMREPDARVVYYWLHIGSKVVVHK